MQGAIHTSGSIRIDSLQGNLSKGGGVGCGGWSIRPDSLGFTAKHSAVLCLDRCGVEETSTKLHMEIVV